MLSTVWVSAWQFECCGADFEVGEVVVWSAHRETIPDTFLVDMLGPDLASKVAWTEDHHELDGEELFEIAGPVRSIKRVFCQRTLNPDNNAYYPVSGSAVLEDVRSNTDRGTVISDWPHFTCDGYLVEVDLEVEELIP